MLDCGYVSRDVLANKTEIIVKIVITEILNNEIIVKI